MTGIDEMFDEIDNFSPHEWPDGVLEHTHKGVIAAAQRVRDFIGVPMYPSPLREAHVRFDKASIGSQHYAVGRFSSAGDFFVKDISAPRLFLGARHAPRIGGVGVYLDTHYNGEPCLMLHIDIRHQPMSWVRQNGEYIYFYENRFWEMLKGRTRDIDERVG